MRYRIFTVALFLIIFLPILSEGTILVDFLHTNFHVEASKVDSVENSKLKLFTSEEPLPIIIYGMQDDDEAFNEVKEWGATHVHRYGMGKSIEKDQLFFDRAEKYGLKVMSDLRARHWLKEEENSESEAFNTYITHFQEHSALGFWYLCDEPDNKGFTPGNLKPLYESIQKEAPQIPVANSHAWTANWHKYGDVQDILMYDNYPVYGDAFPGSKLEAWTKFTESAIKQAKKDNDLLIPVLQIFNWKTFVDNEQSKYRNYSVEELRYPNSEELRYMTFTSIALGAKGLSLFSYSRSKMIKEEWAHQVLKPVINEAKEFAKQIGNINASKFYSLENEKLFLTSFSNEKNSFIVVVNASSVSRSIQFTPDAEREIKNMSDYKLWGETRKSIGLSFTEEQLTIDEMKPWEVIILKK